METLLLVLGSSAAGAIVSGIFGVIYRLMDKKDKPIEERFAALDHRLEKAEKDTIRTQMLIMIADYPGNDQEILDLSKHYFADLRGDWYMTSIFNRWLADRKIGRPEWFNNKD